MDIEIVTDNVPAKRFGIGVHHRLQMREKIGLRTRGSTTESHVVNNVTSEQVLR